MTLTQTTSNTTKNQERLCCANGVPSCRSKPTLLIIVFLLQAPILYFLYSSEVSKWTRESLWTSRISFNRSVNLNESLLQRIVANDMEVTTVINGISDEIKGQNPTQSEKTITSRSEILEMQDVAKLVTTDTSFSQNLSKTEMHFNNSGNFINRTVEKNIIETQENSSYAEANVKKIADQSNEKLKDLPKCPDKPPHLQGFTDVSFADKAHSFEQIHEDNPEIQKGGFYKPKECVARAKVAIIIPFRDRREHLQYFLQFMHPTLQRQQLEYRIYIINQYGKGKFNRAMLMNVGYAESIKDRDFGCFVFHDVDLILENDKALYDCPPSPRHLSAAVDKFNYRLPYASIFGGVTELTKEQFETVNGYANTYWGWGGEDDDMRGRITHCKMNVIRYPLSISRYRMVSHSREVGNEENPQRFDKLRRTSQTMKTDGLNSLKYKVVARDDNAMYTNITVDLHGPP